jgi:catechol 2,3-dioxygenase-like lactoylglutathione lyase family enzyme
MRPKSKINRLSSGAILLIFFLALFAKIATTNAEADRPPSKAPIVGAVEAIGLTVGDLDRSIDFYTRVLSFEKVSEAEHAGAEFERLQGVFGARIRAARLRLGDELIELTEYLAPKGRPIPPDSRSNDRWFQHLAIITPDLDRAYAHLRRNKVAHASSGPQRLPEWNPNAGGIEAFYFKDPDGHPLEILEFPAGKGDEKWHRRTDRLFLGIDHTAIVVEDTERSLRFYRDRLGLRIAGESENYGTEQEHLNNVFGARLRITSLRASGGGPGVEFLEYLSPTDGRPIPIDQRPNDLAHWQTKMTTTDAEALGRQLLLDKYRFFSSGVIMLSRGEAEFERGMLVRDPDGHAVQLIERR